MVDLVLIGCGAIATAAHLPALAALRAEGLVNPVGVADANESVAREAATSHGVAHWDGDWRRLVERTGARAVSLCLPPGPNVRIAIEALEAGLHVMSEKPPARDAGAARRMADAARARPGQVTMIAFNRRFAPLYTRAMERSLALGAPHAFHGRFTRDAMGSAPSNTASDWITSDGSHALDLAIATLGVPSLVSVSRRTCGAGPDNVWTIQLHAPRGTGVVVLDFACGRRVERFEWSGPAYDVVLELPERAEWSARGAAVERWTAASLTGTDDFFTNYGFPDEYRAFARAIGGGARPDASYEYGATFMTIVEAILACRSGESRELSLAPEPRGAEERAGAGAGACAATEGERPATPGRAAAGALARGDAQAPRPVAHILQGAAASARFFDGDVLARAGERCDLRMRTDESGWRDAIQDAEAIVTGWGGVPLSPAELDRAKRLRLVVVIGAAVRAVSPDYLLGRGVVVCNTAAAIAESVAEHCLLLALAGLRRLTDLDAQMHRGGWPPQPASRLSLRAIRNRAAGMRVARMLRPMLRPVAARVDARIRRTGPGGGWSDLRGQIVGLVGWGHIARALARLLGPFECELLVHSSAATDAELAAHGARRAALGEVMASAKVVSVHSGLSDRTRGMIGARELALLQRGSVLVNTARGPIVDEAALLARLARSDVVAALDVYDREPLPRDHALRRLRNVILTPHSASSTPECQRRVGRQALETLIDWAAGRPVRGISPEQLAAMT
ncbi:MAG TPA: NAD(P)-dependent oxidoreductase [Gemmatimonadaceae bacterium]